MYKCPHCGKQGISVWHKLTIGLVISAICKQCGNKVGVPYYAYIVIPLLIATNIIVRYIDFSITLKIVIWVVGTLIIGFIYLKYVPLVPRQNSKDL